MKILGEPQFRCVRLQHPTDGYEFSAWQSFTHVRPSGIVDLDEIIIAESANTSDHFDLWKEKTRALLVKRMAEHDKGLFRPDEEYGADVQN